MDRRDFCKSIALVTAGLLAPISIETKIQTANAQAFSITGFAINDEKSYNIGGFKVADIYGFDPGVLKFDKLILTEKFDIKKPFHIVYSEYAVDDDGDKICFSNTIRNAILTEYNQIDENVFANINYDIDTSAGKRLEYSYDIVPKPTPTALKSISIKTQRKYFVPNSNITYSISI